jgi:geranylgeranylglycerol-phosphate geranylgeranyltransferase
MVRLRVYLRLMRPTNCVMIGFAVMVGAALVSLESISSNWTNLIYGFFTGFMLTAASMAVNDYYDRAIDAINEPNRPIPSGSIRPNKALAFAFILTVVGFVAAYFTNLSYPLCLLTAIVAWALFVTYTTVGKQSGLPGNFLVSACVAIPFIYGSIAVSGSVGANVLIFSSMAFLSNTGREITKGIADVEGDRAQSVKTLAVRYGTKNASIAAALFYFSAVSLSPIPWTLAIVSFWFIPLVFVTDFGLAASSLLILKNHSRENARKIKKTVLFWFTIGLLAFVLGKLR